MLCCMHRLRLLRLLWLLLLWLLIRLSWREGLCVTADVVCDHARARGGSFYHGLGWLWDSPDWLRRWSLMRVIFTAFAWVKVAFEAPFSGQSASNHRRHGFTFSKDVAVNIPAILQCSARMVMLDRPIYIGLDDHGSFRSKIWKGWKLQILFLLLNLAQEVLLTVFSCRLFVIVECRTEENLTFDGLTTVSFIVVFKRVWFVLWFHKAKDQLVI